MSSSTTKIQLSDHFTYQRLFRFVLPSIFMMLFTSIYGVVDGFFVSNFAGKTAFAAVNLIMPFPMLFGAVGFMLGTGGSAIVAATLGQGFKEKANQYFSLIVLTTILAGVLLSFLGFFMLPSIARLFGAEGVILNDCIMYGRILFASLTAFMVQNLFQTFLVTAQKPILGLAVTIAAGFTNIFLDFLFVGIFQWGIAGAGIATAVSQIVGGLFPLAYFFCPNTSLLRLTRPARDLHLLIKTCTNGSSELMTNVSLSLVNILYNYQLMRIASEDGIAAYGVIMYVNFIFMAVFLGYAVGCAPIASYHYGAGNHRELQNIFKKSLFLMSMSGVAMTALAIILSGPLAKIFVSYDSVLMEITKHGFAVYSIAFVFMGFNVFASAFFTALGNGLVSALISFLRTLLFQVAAVIMLPIWFGIDGIWLAITAAELLSLFVSLFFFLKEKKRYHY